MLAFLLTAVLISLSGVMAPGPITTAALAAGARRRHAGLLIAVGHAVVELPLMLMLLAGRVHFFTGTSVRIGIALAGGVVLIVMGISRLRSLFAEEANSSSAVEGHPLITGIVLTAANPYFLLWWGTVGMTLATKAMTWGLAFLGLFALVHWLCDLIWLDFLSLAGWKGTQWFGPNAQRVVSGICGVVLVGFGARFLWGVQGMSWVGN